MKKYKVPKPTVKRPVENGKKQKQSWKLAEQSCPCGHDVTLPWWCPYLVTIVTMVIRVSYVVSPRSWWILHPDEVYQTAEVAFSEISGYGFRSYEYLPAPTNISVSMETQALDSGMFALRSFILPYVFAIATMIARMSGLTSSTFLVCRVFNALVTSFLPLAVYKLVYNVCRCRMVALLSCALTASSLHLAVFGTHPLVNSFTSPFIVIGLSLCLKIDSNTSLGSLGTELEKDSKGFSDLNGNIINIKQRTPGILKDINHGIYENGTGLVVSGEMKKQLSPISRKNKHVEQKETSENAIESSLDEQRPCVKEVGLRWKPFFGGVIVGFTCYTRPDVSLFFVLTFFPLIYIKEAAWTSKLRAMVTVISGGITSVLICIVDDFCHYGLFVFSPVQWLRFNVLSTRASLIFSTDHSNGFFDILWGDRISLVLNISSLTVLMVIPFVEVLQTLNKKPYYSLIVSHMILLFIYSVVGHNELRFIHNSFILQAIIFALTIHYIMIYLQSKGLKSYHLKTSIVVFIFLCAINSYQNFPSIENNMAFDWSYKDAERSRDVNTCLNFIRKQNDVTGVMVNASVYNIGGFAILEHDVPLLVQVHHEYHFYEKMSKNRLGKNNSIRVFTDFTDFIDIDNQPYVYKVMRERNINYIITGNEQEIPLKHLGYENGFTFGKHSVFIKKPYLMDTTEAVFSETLNSVTILEYEANWLITNALYPKAIWRINTALEINRKLRKKSRVRLFQLLMVCYGKMKQWDKVKLYQDKCFSIYGRDVCVSQQDKLVRHDDYHRFN